MKSLKDITEKSKTDKLMDKEKIRAKNAKNRVANKKITKKHKFANTKEATSTMRWFKSFGDNETIIDEKQFKVLTKKLKLPKLSRAAGGHEFLDKTFGSNSDALNITKETNNEYRVTARTDKVKAEVNKALGIKESKTLSDIRKELAER